MFNSLTIIIIDIGAIIKLYQCIPSFDIQNFNLRCQMDVKMPFLLSDVFSIKNTPLYVIIMQS